MDEKWSKRFDKFMVLAGLISPIATIPQILKVYIDADQDYDQSLITWSVYTALAVLWVIYGFRKRQPALIIGNGLGVVMYGLVVIGIIKAVGLTF